MLLSPLPPTPCCEYIDLWATGGQCGGAACHGSLIRLMRHSVTASGEQGMLLVAVLSLSSTYWCQSPLSAMLLSCYRALLKTGVNNSSVVHFNFYVPVKRHLRSSTHRMVCLWKSIMGSGPEDQKLKEKHFQTQLETAFSRICRYKRQKEKSRNKTEQKALILSTFSAHEKISVMMLIVERSSKYNKCY